MKTRLMGAAALVLAFGAPALLAQGADHGHGHSASEAASEEAAPGGMMHGQMHGEMPGGMMGGMPMEEGEMPPEMRERMRAHMEEVMRPMLREIIREVMIEVESERGAPGAALDAADYGAHHAAAGAEDTPATRAYRAANEAMHAAMDIEFSGDPDIDFARGMIGHHEGAIAMARIVLEHGENEELRALAEEIIEAQEAEIAFLRAWLATRGEGE